MTTYSRPNRLELGHGQNGEYFHKLSSSSLPIFEYDIFLGDVAVAELNLETASRILAALESSHTVAIPHKLDELLKSRTV